MSILIALILMFFLIHTGWFAALMVQHWAARRRWRAGLERARLETERDAKLQKVAGERVSECVSENREHGTATLRPGPAGGGFCQSCAESADQFHTFFNHHPLGTVLRCQKCQTLFGPGCPECGRHGDYVRTRWFATQYSHVWTCPNESCRNWLRYWHTDHTRLLPRHLGKSAIEEAHNIIHRESAPQPSTLNSSTINA